MTTDDLSLVRRLGRLDCCAVSDAMDKLGLPGYVGGIERRSTTKRIAGRVMTARLVAVAEAPRPAAPVRHLGTTAIEMASAGDVIVVEQRTGIEAGCWGGILTLGAKVKGIAGVIADGPVRDIDEAASYDFPIFARALTARTARGRVAELETAGTIKVGDVRVDAWDYVVADGSGVVFIRAADIHRLLATAEEISRREAFMTRAILSGEPIEQVMGANYENMLK